MTKPSYLTPDFSRLDYRLLTLPNGLQASLMHDPEAQDSAISLSVFTGSIRDPKERNGLNHFLEHMLFISTDKFPKEDEFSQFLSLNGGEYNGFTSQEQVAYFLKVRTDAFREAVDRFSSFMICPTMKVDAADREINAIQNEHTLRLNNDNFFVYRLTREYLRSDHPARNYACGTKESIMSGGETPEKTVAVLRELFSKYYTAPNMRVAIYSNQSLDEQEDLIRTFFSPIVSTPAPSLSDDFVPKEILTAKREIDQILSSVEYDLAEACHINISSSEKQKRLSELRDKHKDLGEVTDSFTLTLKKDIPAVPMPNATFDPAIPQSSICVIVGKQQKPLLVLSFPVPLLPDTLHDTYSLIGHLLGHESEGSLLSLLKKRGLASQLTAGNYGNIVDVSLVKCSITLTEEGSNRIEEIVSLFFEEVALIQRTQSPLPQYLYNENSTIIAQHAHQQSSLNPLVAVSEASGLNRETPDAFLFLNGLRGRIFSENVFRRVMSFLRPDNMFSMLVLPARSVRTVIEARQKKGLLETTQVQTDVLSSLSTDIKERFDTDTIRAIGEDDILSQISHLLRLERYVGILHFFIPFDQTAVKLWTKEDRLISPQLVNPSPNEFIATDLSLLPLTDYTALHTETHTDSAFHGTERTEPSKVHSVESLFTSKKSIQKSKVETFFSTNPPNIAELCFTPPERVSLPVVVDNVSISKTTDIALYESLNTKSPSIVAPCFPLPILKEDGLEVFYSFSAAHRSARVSVRIEINVSTTLDMLVNKHSIPGVLRLFELLIDEKLKEVLYKMELAQLAVNVRRTSQGYTIDVDGYRDNVEKALSFVSAEFFSPSFSLSLFERVKEHRVRGLEARVADTPYTMLFPLLRVANIEGEVTEQTALEGTKRITYDLMNEIAREMKDEEFEEIKTGFMHNLQKKAEDLRQETQQLQHEVETGKLTEDLKRFGVAANVTKREVQEWLVMAWKGRDGLVKWRESNQQDSQPPASACPVFDVSSLDEPSRFVIRIIPNKHSALCHVPSSQAPFKRDENDTAEYPLPPPHHHKTVFIDDIELFGNSCSLSPNLHLIR
ncbi:putative Insulin-degrading enzyme like protein [Blattamonas nauphoetae]|uniref:Insulin-degrading enzyme like protein n=1 Tax=Blattamonas nauphoetae TaxID=2049346 RepID=A0ABQ9YI81_9EUKA|nr:putative Insulin-degrading enzyme like protein [Blattamonas nauphoetae]